MYTPGHCVPFFVASYDSQGYDGGILFLLQTGITLVPKTVPIYDTAKSGFTAHCHLQNEALTPLSADRTYIFSETVA
jgi:hypothetical protein